MKIELITALQTRELRQTVLRPNQHKDDLHYPGDDDFLTRHFAVFFDEEIIGIISIYQENSAVFPYCQSQWRIRGMAVLPEYRQQGLATKLYINSENYVLDKKGELIWCNARVSAVPFYQKLGFIIHGEEFNLPGIGPHYVMWKRILT